MKALIALSMIFSSVSAPVGWHGVSSAFILMITNTQSAVAQVASVVAAQLPPSEVVTPEPAQVPEVYYGSCADARAAGAAPLRTGDPGYRSGLDRDGDGVACEE